MADQPILRDRSEREIVASRYAGELWIWRLLITGPRAGWANVTRAVVIFALLALLMLLPYGVITGHRGTDFYTAAGFLVLSIGAGLLELRKQARHGS